MKQALQKFLRDESGAVTIDSVVVLGGSMYMAMAIVADVGYATMGVTEKINERLEYATIIAEILDDYGPDDNSVDCAANPGNDKCVGNAGEDPNGTGDWGDGTQGMSQ